MWSDAARNAPLASAGAVVLIGSSLLRAAAFAPVSAATGIAYLVLCVGGLAGAVLAWKRSDVATITIVFIVAIGARVILFASAPIFSHDAYRYLWDARVIAAGYDPVALSPDDPSLVTLARTPLYAFIDYRNIPSLYPPLAYAAFYAGSLPGFGVYGEKLVVLAGDAVALGTLFAMLRRGRAASGRLAVYAWSPLVLLEFAQNGHIESLAVAGIVVTALAIAVGNRTVAAVALAGATLVKLTPAAFIAAAFVRAPRWAFGCVLACIAVFAAAYALGIPASHSLGAYVSEQRFFPTVFRVAGPIGAGSIFLALVAWTTWRRRVDMSFAAAVLAIQAGFLLCSPNALPWYATVVPATAPLVETRSATWRFAMIAAVALSSALPLTYGSPAFPAGAANGLGAAIVGCVLAGALIFLRRERWPAGSQSRRGTRV